MTVRLVPVTVLVPGDILPIGLMGTPRSVCLRLDRRWASLPMRPVRPANLVRGIRPVTAPTSLVSLVCTRLGLVDWGNLREW